ncbi:TIGR00341 family protein [Halomarina halobia]|uniref:TIGR00341 family protein n=1 Tax=Halomarina halobia TaxID=3033386 RepID=A0ABD6ABG6_9EURY|nr:TIGR00341 family protein [Halomarina sp. PSR21]
MRLVQIALPTAKRETVLGALDDEGIDYVVSDETSGREYDAVVSFPVPTSAVEDVLARLRGVGIDERSYTVVTDATTVVSERFDALEESYEEDGGSEDRIAREELLTRANDLASKPGIYVALTVISAVIATAGLLLDSPATVVGSMVIAPLIGPAMAASVGTVVDDRELWIRGVRMQFLGLGLSVLSAAAFALLVRWTNLVPPSVDPTTIPQVRERIAPDFLSLAVALGAGTAGALSLRTGVSTALVGVMIAVALIPPAATVGIGVAYGIPGVALSSSVLVLVNVLSINLAALVVLWYSGYRPEQFFRREEARSATAKRVAALLFAIAVLSVFLGGVTYDSYQTAKTKEAINAQVDAAVAETDSPVVLLETSIETDRGGLFLDEPTEVVVTVGAPPGERPDDLAERIDRRIRRQTGTDLAVEVRYVEVTRASIKPAFEAS